MVESPFDGANGEEDVLAKFREVSSKLYNSWGTEQEMGSIKQKISSLIQTEGSTSEVLKITGEIVKKAASKMKSAKSDVSGSFSSDVLLMDLMLCLIYLL